VGNLARSEANHWKTIQKVVKYIVARGHHCKVVLLTLQNGNSSASIHSPAFIQYENIATTK